MEKKIDVEQRLIKFVESVSSEEHRLIDMLAPKVVSCDKEQRETRILFTIKEWEKNQRGEIHGGAIAAMFDTAMGCSAATFDSTGAVTTTDLHVSYIRPFLEREYMFVSQVVHPGRTLIRVESKAVSRQTGKVAATCTATFCPYRR